MAINAGNVGNSITAGATFANSDLGKFLGVNSSGHAVIGATTASGFIVGTLNSVTATTSGAGSEVVNYLPLEGQSPVFMAGSTRAAGQTVAASSQGMGIAPTTDQAALGIALVGSSGGTGRMFTVAWGAASAADV